LYWVKQAWVYISAVIPVFESKEMYGKWKAVIMESLDKVSPATNEACIGFLDKLKIPASHIDAQAIRNQKVSGVYAKFCSTQVMHVTMNEHAQDSHEHFYVDWKVYFKYGAELRKIVNDTLLAAAAAAAADPMPTIPTTPCHDQSKSPMQPSAIFHPPKSPHSFKAGATRPFLAKLRPNTLSGNFFLGLTDADLDLMLPIGSTPGDIFCSKLEIPNLNSNQKP